jgi:hypothetical protein
MVRKKKVKKVRRNVPKRKKISQPRDKIKLVFSNLLLFVVLTVLSLIAFSFVTNTILVNLFQVMIIAFAFISVGLLIALLVLVIVKTVKNSK